MTESLSNLTATSAMDNVAVYDENLNQVFPEGRPIKAAVNENATFFKHPLEDSSVRTDHIIIEPVTVTLISILTGAEYRNTYKQIKSLFLDQTPLIVQTRTDSYENMYINAMPHDEDSIAFDAVTISIDLTETQTASAVSSTIASFKAEFAQDDPTAIRGQQQSNEPTEGQQQGTSILSRVFG